MQPNLSRELHPEVGETFIGISSVPRVLRAVISDYLKRSGIEIVPHLEIDNFAMAISLVASTRGVALLPASAENFLKWSVISRPLKGEAPTIDLVGRISQGEHVPDPEDIPLQN